MANKKKNASQPKSQPKPPRNPPPRPTSRVEKEDFNLFEAFRREKKESKK